MNKRERESEIKVQVFITRGPYVLVLLLSSLSLLLFGVAMLSFVCVVLCGTVVLLLFIILVRIYSIY